VNAVLLFLGQRLRVIVTILLAVILAVVLVLINQRHAMPTCTPPTVPIQQFDARFTGIGCATVGPYRAWHGVWVDAAEASWFYPDATTAPRPDKLGQTDGWIFLDPADRAAIYRALAPVGEHERVRDQVVSVAFDGTEYRVDQKNRYNLHRFFDIGNIHAVRMLRRDFISDRIKQ
jgi:hypothetical protein